MQIYNDKNSLKRYSSISVLIDYSKHFSDKSITFKNIQFTINKYQVGNSLVSPATFDGDGSTLAFELNEIVHEDDIKVRKDSTEVYVGSNVTADNNLSPTYLTADGTLRSADYENEISLLHDSANNKTTIIPIKRRKSE